jgi:hypothetical protein
MSTDQKGPEFAIRYPDSSVSDAELWAEVLDDPELADHMTTQSRRTLAAAIQPIHKVADNHEASVMTAVRYIFAKGRAAVKGLPPALTPDAAAKAVYDATLDVMPETLTPIVHDGGKVAVQGLVKHRAAEMRALADPPTRVDWRFDVSDPRSVEWAQQHAADLAQGLSDTTRDDIRQAIADALESGQDPTDAIAEAVGDDDRALLITRTETMTAANEGQREGWLQAQEDGLLGPMNVRVWIATEGACPECEDLDGTTAPIDGEYEGDGGDGPPLHPNCRCTEGIQDAS